MFLDYLEGDEQDHEDPENLPNHDGNGHEDLQDLLYFGLGAGHEHPEHLSDEEEVEVDNDDHNVERDSDPEDPDDNGFEEIDDYDTILKHLSKKWLEVERTHNVSKTCSDAFWELGKEWFHKLFTTKANQNVRRKTPSFVHIRRRLYDDHVPPVKMQIAYKHKDSGELTVLEDSLVTPKSKFPAHEYHKMWEIAHIEVKNFFTYRKNVLCLLYAFSSVLFVFMQLQVRPSQKKVT